MRRYLSLLLLVAVAAFSAAPPAATQPVKPRPAVPTTLEELDRTLGDPAAPIQVIEYASLTCPHCAAFHNDTFAAVRAEYIDTGRVFWTYRDFPLDGAALTAATVAHCVAPDRYFEIIGRLYAQQGNWSRARDPEAALAGIAAEFGLAGPAFDACLGDGSLQDLIVERAQIGQELGVTGTPYFLIDGAGSSGNRSINEFRSIFDRSVKPRG